MQGNLSISQKNHKYKLKFQKLLPLPHDDDYKCILINILEMFYLEENTKTQKNKDNDRTLYS